MNNKKAKSNINNVEWFIQEQLYIQDELYYNFVDEKLEDEEDKERGVWILDLSEKT